jgi:hypothetical protein
MILGAKRTEHVAERVAESCSINLRKGWKLIENLSIGDRLPLSRLLFKEGSYVSGSCCDHAGAPRESKSVIRETESAVGHGGVLTSALFRN